MKYLVLIKHSTVRIFISIIRMISYHAFPITGLLLYTFYAQFLKLISTQILQCVKIKLIFMHLVDLIYGIYIYYDFITLF